MRTSQEIRILDLQTNTSVLLSNDVRDKEAKWFGVGNQVVWLKEVYHGATEIWIGDADDVGRNYVDLKSLTQPASRHCAVRIGAKASHLKLQDQHEDIGIAVACPSTSNRALYNSQPGARYTGDVCNTIWYSNLRKKAMSNTTLGTKYVISPTRFVNALRGTGLESPLHSPFGASTDFEISMSGIVFLAKASMRHPGGANTYYIPRKSFTELSKPRPQVIQVKGFEGGSSNPVLSKRGLRSFPQKAAPHRPK